VAARQEPKGSSAPSEGTHRCAPYAGRSPGDNDNLFFGHR
jgi:hypothetical protein